MTHISGFERSQILLLPEAVDDYVGADNPVRFIDAFVDELDLSAAGFVRVAAKAKGRPGYAPADLLGVVARIWRGLAFGQEEAVEGWFVKLPSGFPSDAEQAQRRSSASFREDEIQGQELGFV
jgi:hypothetical protein